MTSKIWRVKSSSKCDYIRATSLDTAAELFLAKYKHKAEEFQVIDNKVFRVLFSDVPYDPAYFYGTKKEALARARLYIRQWQLNATISSITEV